MLAAIASARGANDGSTREDAWTSQLVNENGVTLDVHTWNEFDTDASAWDLLTEVKFASNDKNPDFKISIAFKVPDVTTYDAFSIAGTSLTSESPQFIFVDGYFEQAEIAQMKTDDGYQTG